MKIGAITESLGKNRLEAIRVYSRMVSQADPVHAVEFLKERI
jgi:hypothetical protein